MAKSGGHMAENRFGFTDDFGTNSITGEEDNLRVHVQTLGKLIFRGVERSDSTAPPGRLPAVRGFDGEDSHSSYGLSLGSRSLS